MIFGLCANRVIGFVVAFVKDVSAANKSVSVSQSSEDEKISARSSFEEVTTDEKKYR